MTLQRGIPDDPTVRNIVELLGDSYHSAGIAWALEHVNHHLGGRCPIDLLDTVEGRKEVYRWARRLSEGMGS